MARTPENPTARRRAVLGVAFGALLALGALGGCGSCGESKSTGAAAATDEGDAEAIGKAGRHRPFRLRWDGGFRRRHHGEGGALDVEGGAPTE